MNLRYMRLSSHLDYLVNYDWHCAEIRFCKRINCVNQRTDIVFRYRALTIGQMQGKFQMVVVRHTGHAIQVGYFWYRFVVFWFKSRNCHVNKVLGMMQEDVPDEFASLVLNFISRNRIGPNGIEVGFFGFFSGVNLVLLNWRMIVVFFALL